MLIGELWLRGSDVHGLNYLHCVDFDIARAKLTLMMRLRKTDKCKQSDYLVLLTTKCKHCFFYYSKIRGCSPTCGN